MHSNTKFITDERCRKYSHGIPYFSILFRFLLRLFSCLLLVYVFFDRFSVCIQIIKEKHRKNFQRNANVPAKTGRLNGERKENVDEHTKFNEKSAINKTTQKRMKHL